MAIAGGSAAQELGRRMSYHGTLAGLPAGRVATVAFALYDAAGNRVWGPEEHLVTPDAEGHFSTVVGVTGLDASPRDGTPDLDQVDPRGLALEVGVRDAGVELVRTARQPLVPAHHARSAARVAFAETLAGDSIVSNDSLQDGAVTSSRIANGTITGADIAASTLTSIDIATGAVGSAALANGAVGAGDLGPDSIGRDQLRDAAIGSGQLATGAIQGVDIADRAVTNGKLALSTDAFVAAAGVPFETTSLGEWQICLLAGVRFPTTRLAAPGETTHCRLFYDGFGANGAPLWFLERSDAPDEGGVLRTRCEARCF
jgi:hypothetical protein